MRRLADAGLTTREACGNSVRNITACPYAGVAADEPFDVTPYAEALTRYLLRHPLSSTLPRKFKIAFEGCPDDHIGAGHQRHRLARASAHATARSARLPRHRRRRHGHHDRRRATSCSSSCRPARCSTSPRPSFACSTRLGDYKHKQRNRMKFLIKSLGWDGLRGGVRRRSSTRSAPKAAPGLPFDAERPPVEEAPDWTRAAPPSVGRHRARVPLRRRSAAPASCPASSRVLRRLSDDFARLARDERPAAEAGRLRRWSTVTVAARRPHGAQMRRARRAGAAPTATARCASPPIRTWCSAGCRTQRRCRQLYARLAAAGLGLGGRRHVRRRHELPGRRVVQAGGHAVARPRPAPRRQPATRRPDLVAAVPGLDIKISGCPNGCGQHHIAGIGFQGSLRKVGGKPAPQYFVMVGGGVAGRQHDVRPSRREGAGAPGVRCARAPGAAVSRPRAARPTARSAFFRRVEVAARQGAARRSRDAAPEDGDRQDFIDLAEDHAFNPEVMDGECSA